MNGVSVDFGWSPTPADWQDALRTSAPVYRWAPRFTVALAVVSAAVALMDMMAAALFGLVFAAMIAAAVPVQVRQSFHAHPLAGATVAATADDHSLRMIVGTSDRPEQARTELAWHDLPGWSETARGFVLRAGECRGGPVYAVPHRAFAEAGDRQRFRCLLECRIGPAS